MLTLWIASVVYVTATPTGSTKKTSSNTGGIVAGVVVGVVAAAAILGGIFFFIRRRRNREIEEEHRRNAAVSAFMKPPGSSSGYSIDTDARLDPVMAQRRLSSGSIADNQDYSRRILRVSITHNYSFTKNLSLMHSLGYQRLRLPPTYEERLPPVLYFTIGISGVWEISHVLPGSIYETSLRRFHFGVGENSTPFESQL